MYRYNLTSVSHTGLIQSLALVTNHDRWSLSTSHWLVATGNLFQRYDGLLRTPHLTRQQPFQVLCVYDTHTHTHNHSFAHETHTRAYMRGYIRTHAHMHASMHDACIHVRTYIAYTHRGVHRGNPSDSTFSESVRAKHEPGKAGRSG